MRTRIGALAGLLLALGTGCAEAPEGLLLATTTSVHDSGLLEDLLPGFTEETGFAVRVVAVGSGAALRMGAEGNADLLLTHAPAAERQLVDDGIVAARIPIMENYFVIAGPDDDPLGLVEAATVLDALRVVRAAGAPWVSRGDDSGTHRKERELWRKAGFSSEGGWDAYLSTGSGMGHSLQVAGERRAYLLSDLGTFLAFRDRTDLVAVSGTDASLRNVYSLLRLDASRFAGRIRDQNAAALIAYLVRPEVQARIGEFGLKRFGQPLFRPIAGRADG